VIVFQVMALQALGAYAEKAYSANFNLTLKVQNGADSHQFVVNPQNALVLQSFEAILRLYLSNTHLLKLPNLDSPVELEAVGSSLAFVQVQYSYHRLPQREDMPFYCQKELKEQRNGNRLQLELCCNWTRPGRSNMAVAEVEALSGFRFDEEELRRLTAISDLQRVELDKEDSKANIYFNPVGFTKSMHFPHFFSSATSQSACPWPATLSTKWPTKSPPNFFSTTTRSRANS